MDEGGCVGAEGRDGKSSAAKLGARPETDRLEEAARDRAGSLSRMLLAVGAARAGEGAVGTGSGGSGVATLAPADSAGKSAGAGGGAEGPAPDAPEGPVPEDVEAPDVFCLLMTRTGRFCARSVSTSDAVCGRAFFLSFLCLGSAGKCSSDSKEVDAECCRPPPPAPDVLAPDGPRHVPGPVRPPAPGPPGTLGKSWAEKLTLDTSVSMGTPALA